MEFDTDSAQVGLQYFFTPGRFWLNPSFFPFSFFKVVFLNIVRVVPGLPMFLATSMVHLIIPI